jgi:hypothetical protein
MLFYNIKLHILVLRFDYVKWAEHKYKISDYINFYFVIIFTFIFL